MAKNAKISADTTVDTTVELIFDGINWIDANATPFDFDSFEFDGLNWIPKA
jgi:hypothetical protein